MKAVREFWLNMVSRGGGSPWLTKLYVHFRSSDSLFLRAEPRLGDVEELGRGLRRARARLLKALEDKEVDESYLG